MIHYKPNTDHLFFAMMSSLSQYELAEIKELCDFIRESRVENATMNDDEKIMARGGQKIAAIKSLRERHKIGLKDAKDIVEKYQSDMWAGV